MVPCPEEHLPAVTLAVFRLQAGSTGWDDDLLAEFVASLSPVERSLVVGVATASAEDGHLRYREAAARLALDVGEVLLMVTSINDRCRRASMPLPLITDTEASTDASGEAAAQPVLRIVPAVAVRMLAHLRPAAEAG